MKLRTKLTLVINIILLISILVVAFVSIYQFRKEFHRNIDEYRTEAVNNTLNQLKDIVNIAYSMIDNSYQLSNSEQVQRNLQISLADTSLQAVRLIYMNMMKITLSNLRVLRFGVDGYLWINDFEPPYRVEMHGAKRNLEGKSWVFYIEGTDVNVYEAFHDSIVVGNGAARVTYDFYKPGTNDKIQKISWVRLYKPLNWVIGTGVYIDYIDKIVKIKEDMLKAEIKNFIYVVVLITVFFIFFSTIILAYFTGSITKPILKIQEQLNEIAKGKEVNELKIRRKDEIGDIANSLNSLINGLQRYSHFAAEIGSENYLAQFEKLSKDDSLGTALLNMRDSLSNAKIREQNRLLEERKRQWVTEGINRIGDIITISKSITQLTENVIIRLVDHTKSTIGSIFILDFDNKKEPFLFLSASIAYERQKHLEKRIEMGEGLVGACFLEQKPINITDVPDNYVSISTGLGTAKPKNIYLSPLKFENEVYGVIEIASFTVFDAYTLEFIEEVSKLLAISLSTKEKYSRF